MVITIDIGNTATKVVATMQKRHLSLVKVEGHNPKSVREAIIDARNQAMAAMEKEEQQSLPQLQQAFEIEHVAVSSTVGYSDELKDELREFTPLYLDHTTPIPIENCYSTPQTLGPDRLAAVIGAHAKCTNKDVLVIDAGTAITYDYITAEGKYLGGNIAPGIQLRLLSLNEHTAKLPLVPETGETPDFGFNTETAIRAGVINGVKHEIEGYIREIMQKKGDVSVFLTGGSAINFEDSIKRCTFADDFLVHDGLYNIIMYRLNKEKR